MNTRILLFITLFSVALLLLGANVAMANAVKGDAPDKVMNCGTCYNTYICPQAMNSKEAACNLKYHSFAGWSRIDGPNLILTNRWGEQKKVVLTANTLMFPKMLDLKKPHYVYVKYVTDEGLSQAIEVVNRR